jgi:hypothetical protein
VNYRSLEFKYCEELRTPRPVDVCSYEVDSLGRRTHPMLVVMFTDLATEQDLMAAVEGHTFDNQTIRDVEIEDQTLYGDRSLVVKARFGLVHID